MTRASSRRRGIASRSARASAAPPRPAPPTRSYPDKRWDVGPPLNVTDDGPILRWTSAEMNQRYARGYRYRYVDVYVSVCNHGIGIPLAT